MSTWLDPTRPYVIAHRGASAYAPDCSLKAYETAARLGADMWEVDIRSAACGTLITYHDAKLPDGQAIAELSAAQIAAAAHDQTVPAVPFADILARAVEHGAGIYADIKDTDATLPTLNALKAHGVERAILGAFDPQAAALLEGADCPYPRSVLVPVGVDPFEFAKGADVIHLCWENMARPQDALTPAFFAKAKARGQHVVLWHEEDPERMAVLRDLPVLGICSDRPELVHPFQPPAEWPFEVACHRGACEFAPENTLAAAHCAFAGGFDYVELDLHQSADGHVVVFHDVELRRCTNGRGAVSWHTLEALKQLDAGSRHDSFFAAETIPSFAEMLAVAGPYGGQFYVELKEVDPHKVLSEVQAADMLERCFFWSYNIAQLRSLRAACPAARLMVRRQDVPTLDAVQDLAPEIIEFTLDDDLSEIETCRARGMRAMLAYMGHNEDAFDQIVQARPDIVNLHFPYRFRDYINKVFA